MRKLSFLMLAICLSFGRAYAQSWDINGNAGISPTVNFIGTLDDSDVVFKRHGVLSGLLDSNLWNTGWGVQTLKSNTSGFANVAVGILTGTGYTDVQMCKCVNMHINWPAPSLPKALLQK